jgi:hypothetical protein
MNGLTYPDTIKWSAFRAAVTQVEDPEERRELGDYVFELMRLESHMFGLIHRQVPDGVNDPDRAGSTGPSGPHAASIFWGAACGE